MPEGTSSAPPLRSPWQGRTPRRRPSPALDRKSTRLNSSHSQISYAVFCFSEQVRRGDGDYVHRRRAEYYAAVALRELQPRPEAVRGSSASLRHLCIDEPSSACVGTALTSS